MHLIVVHKLIGKRKGMREKTKDQAGQQGDTVVLPGLRQFVQNALKEQGAGIGRLHGQDAPFFSDIIVSIAPGVNMWENACKSSKMGL